jgi:hypothetical protein
MIATGKRFLTGQAKFHEMIPGKHAGQFVGLRILTRTAAKLQL